MQIGIKSISLDGSTEILVCLGLFPRAVGLGRLMHASVTGVDAGFVCPDCICSVPLFGITTTCMGFNPDVFLSFSDWLLRGASCVWSCGGKSRPAPINEQFPGCTLWPQGSVPTCFCGRRSINL